MKKDTITAKSESFEEMTLVKFESYEDVRKANEERRKELNDWKNGIEGTEIYQPTNAEEMKLTGDPNFRWVGKGPLY